MMHFVITRVCACPDTQVKIVKPTSTNAQVCHVVTVERVQTQSTFSRVRVHLVTLEQHVKRILMSAQARRVLTAALALIWSIRTYANVQQVTQD